MNQKTAAAAAKYQSAAGIHQKPRPLLRAEVLSPRPYTPNRSASIGIPCIIIPILRVRTPCLNSRSQISIPPPGNRSSPPSNRHPSSSDIFPQGPRHRGVPVVPSSPGFSHIPAPQSHRRFAPRSHTLPDRPDRPHTYPKSDAIKAPDRSPPAHPILGGSITTINLASGTKDACPQTRRYVIIATRNNAPLSRPSVRQRPHQTCLSRPIRLLSRASPPRYRRWFFANQPNSNPIRSVGVLATLWSSRSGPCSTLQPSHSRNA